MNTAAANPAASVPAAGTPDNRWTVAAEDFAALRAGPVATLLSDHATLEFDGPDARSFLQGQLTIDVVGLAPDDVQIGGYCTPKGRLLAVFLVWSYAAGLRLLVPRVLAPSLQKRLSTYVLRAKVAVRDVTADWQAWGLCGAAAAAPLAAAGIPVPDEPGKCAARDVDEHLLRLTAGPTCTDRLILLVRSDSAARYAPALRAFARVGTGLWWWAQIDAGVPAVLADTQERFVPQAINLEVLGGVNFRKGCYPGQEVVARSQYLGKLRRRMALAHAAELGPAADIFHDGSNEAVGRIVLAASAPQGGWDLLFECPSDRTEGARLHAGATDAPALELRELPYRLFDPTA